MPTFAHLTDIHLRPPGVLTQGIVDTDAFAVAAVDAVIQRHADIDAVIVTGDIADRGEVAAYDRAEMLLSRFSVPVFVVPGNHDKTARFQTAFSTFPGMAEPPVLPKLAHTHTVGDIRLICLDTSVDDVDRHQHHGTLGAAQIAWLDETLGAGEPTLIAMHHPPFETGIVAMDRIGLTDAAEFAEVVARRGNVVRIVCGHVHRTIVGSVAGTTAMIVPGTAHQVSLSLSEETPFGMVMEPPAFGVHRVSANGAVSHVSYVDVYGAPQTFAGDGDDAAEAVD